MNTTLAAISEQRLREAVIEALQAARKASSGRTTLEYKDVIARVATICLGQDGATAYATWTAHEIPPFDNAFEWPDRLRLQAAVWSLVSDGAVVPRFKMSDKDVSAFFRLTLTEKGERLLNSGAAHPLHPDSSPGLGQARPRPQTKSSLTSRMPSPASRRVFCVRPS